MQMNDELLQYGIDVGMCMCMNLNEIVCLFDFYIFLCQVPDMFQPCLVVMEGIVQKVSLLSLDCSPF